MSYTFVNSCSEVKGTTPANILPELHGGKQMEENRSGFRGEERDKITAWLLNILHRRNSLIKIHDPLYSQITRAEVTHWGRTPSIDQQALAQVLRLAFVVVLLLSISVDGTNSSI